MESKDITHRTRYKNKPPSSLGIIFIILLGAGGLIGSLFYLSHNIRLNGYRQETWAVRDSSVTKGQPTLIDTLHVIVHPNIQLQKALPKNITAKVEWDYKDLYMTYNPTFLVWISLISLMLGLSLAMLPIIIKYISDIYKHLNLNKWDLVGGIGITAVIGICVILSDKIPYVLTLFKLIDKAGILLEHPYSLNIYILICIFTGLVAILGQLLINYSVSNLPEDVFTLTTAEEKKDAVAQFLLLRDRLKFFLMADATLIVLSILTTDTLKRAVFQEIKIAHDDVHILFPQEFVYLYGMIFTLYLALLYIPVYYRLKYKGETMVENLDPDNADQVKLAANFIIQESAIDSFKIALSILAPVVSSLLPGLIKIG